MTDIHAHILPGIDDGARTEAEALRMLEEARAAGVSTLVATPHVRKSSDFRPAIWQAFDALLPKAEAMGIRLRQGYEVNIRAFSDIRRYDALCFSLTDGGARYLLLELEAYTTVNEAAFAINDIVREGICPILAHPERYPFVQAEGKSLAELCGYGALAQVDAGAFFAGALDRQRRTAKRLLKHGWIHSIASDAHRTGEYRRFAQAIRLAGRKYAWEA